MNLRTLSLTLIVGVVSILLSGCQTTSDPAAWAAFGQGLQNYNNGYQSNLNQTMSQFRQRGVSCRTVQLGYGQSRTDCE